MPAANPFSPTIEVGAGASVGPASGKLSGQVDVGDHTVSAGYILLALALLVVLHKTGRFRFSTQVG